MFIYSLWHLESFSNTHVLLSFHSEASWSPFSWAVVWKHQQENFHLTANKCSEKGLASFIVSFYCVFTFPLFVFFFLFLTVTSWSKLFFLFSLSLICAKIKTDIEESKLTVDQTVQPHMLVPAGSNIPQQDHTHWKITGWIWAYKCGQLYILTDSFWHFGSSSPS